LASKSGSRKTQILPPAEAVEIAWARTDEISSNKSVQASAEIPKKIMQDKIKRAEELKDPREQNYVGSANSAIEAAYRNLATARNYLDLSFNDIKELGQKEQEKIEYLEKFSGDLQSIIPKLATMTIGGVAGGALLSGIFENLFPASMKGYAMPLLLGLSAAVAYFLHGLIIVPVVKKRLERQVMQTQFDKVQYYKQYLARISSILQNLYVRIEEAHENYFKKKYSANTKSEDVVKKILSGMQQDRCKNIEECLKGHKTSPSQWSTCETGIGSEQCTMLNK
jgi:hypothetical protein